MEPSSPKPLSGWLILVGIGLFVSPLRLIAVMLDVHVPLLQEGTWEVLTDPAGEAYHPLWKPLLVFEIAGNLVFLAVHICLLVLFFRRARWFPLVYIAASLGGIAFIVADASLISLVLPDEPMFDPATAQELGRAVVGALIWVPYMLLSKRVKHTFVEPDANGPAAGSIQ